MAKRTLTTTLRLELLRWMRRFTMAVTEMPTGAIGVARLVRAALLEDPSGRPFLRLGGEVVDPPAVAGLGLIKVFPLYQTEGRTLEENIQQMDNGLLLLGVGVDAMLGRDLDEVVKELNDYWSGHSRYFGFRTWWDASRNDPTVHQQWTGLVAYQEEPHDDLPPMLY